MLTVIAHKLPYNLDAEEDIIASIIVDNNNINSVISFLKPEHFYSEINQIIYEQIVNISNDSKVADIVNISYNLSKNKIFQETNGKDYLSSIINRVSVIIPTRERGLIVYDSFVRRKLIEISQNINNKANSLYERGFDDIIEFAESEIFRIRNDSVTKSEPKAIINYFREILTSTDKARKSNVLSGISTGFVDMDEILSGMNPSDLIILAARPSMGKTALAINIAYNAASLNNKKDFGGVAFFSLEMSSEQISTRILSMISGISSVAIRTGKYTKYDEEYEMNNRSGQSLDDQDFSKLQDVVHELQNIPLYIDDTPSISTSLLKNRARTLKRRHNISLIIVDYLQLMRSSEINANGNRVLEISEITQTLKAIAKELNIPVIALSQLSRAVELRDDKRPQLSDLRESGSIEQDADVVMFIYREEYYLEKSKPKDPVNISDKQAKDTKEYDSWMGKMYGASMKDANNNPIVDKYTGEIKLSGGVKNVAEIIISKHRNGPVGKIHLFFDKTRTLFQNLVE